ncbi:MAG: maleylpyruvate isomerase family mycothiol-dependent enzyme [Intrasporangium sp.]|uniref:maleylpyruvate isomerase family mycothiol-dependent enzyme n=1 Tax=Intrasporangium sp. TaxID=1925024 RepID=UPI002649B434|nr:maleylpyruvate isomerase family mycothiol-dependent enzyme [Intrasporangium sp.]MDN5794904.1 maleylpyruvate isomerase family mycothiol-dependent enzyme [Intrasporangium sp.]
MDDDEIWAAIDDQYRRTADLLERLTSKEWQHPSLCDGWTVRHVAAHLTLQQQGVRDVVAFMARHPELLRARSLNQTIHVSAVIQARLPTEQIIGRVRAMIGSRRHNVFVTRLETLSDILVHGQDIAVPLGADLEMPVPATVLAATRLWETRDSWLGRVFHKLPLDGYTLRATDTEWTRGDGPEVAGSIGALLLLVTGRTARLDELAGDGADRLRGEHSPA